MPDNVSSAAPAFIEIGVVTKPTGPLALMEASEASRDTVDPIYDDTGYSPRQICGQMGQLLEQSQQAQKILGVLETLAKISDSTGGYVQLRPEYRFCPVLVGNDNRAIPLYEVVEVIDGLIDYEGIKEELPTLSYAQIHGAISFLRKFAQFNASGIDIDDLEDELLIEDETQLQELKRALADQEITRVLNLGNRDL